MYTSKLSFKNQITLPKKVRDAAHLSAGDFIVYEIQEDESIKIKRMEPFDAAFHKALTKTMDEWESVEDEKAFHDI